MLLILAGCSTRLSGSIPPAALPQTVGASQDAPRRILLLAFDAHGNRLDWSAFRQLETNGKSGYANDALIDPATLLVTRIGPLFSSSGTAGGDPSLTLSAQRSAALSLAWPTTAGYSNLMIALPSNGGTYDFDELSAAQVLADVAASLAARAWYQPSAKFERLYANARSEYARALRARNEARAGALAAQSLDAGVGAETELLAQAGIAYARAHHNAFDWGATFDTIEGGAAGLKVEAKLYPKNGWLRICFDPGEKPAYYAPEIARAHALGLRVVGQILDSSEMRRWSVARFEQRTREYVGALTGVDEWETGNEVNGSWLGSISSVVEKTSYASKYVKAHSHARVLVTLYWELGTGSAANATFNWAQQQMKSIAPYVDDLGISLYPRQNPMGEPFDRAIAALHAAFPQQRMMITELDYDEGRGWWWNSKEAIASAGRDGVAKLYQSAIMGYPYSGGGTFWWYFVEEVSPGNALYETLKSVYRSASS